MSALSFAERRAAECAKAVSLVKSVAYRLEYTHDEREQVKLLWELGFVHLRAMEDFREIK